MKNVPEIIINYLSHWGKITKKSMFGTYRLFCDDACFAFYAQDSVYLRAGIDNAALFKLQGIEPYVQMRKSGNIVTHFYPIPESWWNQLHLLEPEVSKSIKQAKIDHLKSRTKTIRQLANMNTRKEKLLSSVGITSVEKLFSLGSVSAYLLVKAQHPSISESLLLDLEGAVSSRFKETFSTTQQNELHHKAQLAHYKHIQAAG